MADLIEVDDASFQTEVLEANIPVLVDFWAVWCGPCRALTPAVEATAAEMAGQVKVCKVDVDKSPDTATEYGIRSIPTLLFFKNGKEENRIVGIVDKDKIKSTINPLL